MCFLFSQCFWSFSGSFLLTQSCYTFIYITNDKFIFTDTCSFQTSDITFFNCSFCNIHMYNNLIALLHLVYSLIACIYMNRKARLLTVGFCDLLYLLFIYFLWYFFSKDTKFIVFVKSLFWILSCFCLWSFLSLTYDTCKWTL